MSDQQAEEWDKMTQQQRDEMQAGWRLRTIIAATERAEYRGRLARASATSPRAFDAIRQTGI